MDPSILCSANTNRGLGKLMSQIQTKLIQSEYEEVFLTSLFKLRSSIVLHYIILYLTGHENSEKCLRNV